MTTKQDLFFSLRFPGTKVYYISGTVVRSGFIKKVKIVSDKSSSAIKVLRENPLNRRWNHPAYPLQVLYKVNSSGVRVWIESSKLYDTLLALLESNSKPKWV